MKKVRIVLALSALMSLVPLGSCYGQSDVQGSRMPSDAPAEVKAQIESLHSFDPVERRNAAQELGRMGERAAPAVPILIRALNDSARLAVRSPEGEQVSASVAEASMRALANIGAPSVDPLIVSLKNDNPGVRTMAVAALGRIDDPRTIDPLIDVLENDDDALVQAAAVDALRKKKHPRVLEALLVAEQNGSWVVRSLAKSAVEEARASTEDQVPSSVEEAPPAPEVEVVGTEGEGVDAGQAVPVEEVPGTEMAEEDPTPEGGESPPPEAFGEAEAAEGRTHTVQRDETLYRIGRRYGVSWQSLMEVNDLRDPTDLYVGQVLRIPAGAEGGSGRGETSPGGLTPASGAGTGWPETEGTHVVQKGDNLYRIGLRYGIPWQTLMEYNHLRSTADLAIGQKLKIPPWDAVESPLLWDGVTTYTVQHGDILYDIGLLFGMSWRHIAALNGLTEPDQIYVGQVLKIPTQRSPASSQPQD
jgi:LysM repeat protein